MRKNRPGSVSVEDLFDWSSRQPQPYAEAPVVAFRAWREKSRRWLLQIKPRGETAAAALLRFDRRAGLAPPRILPFTRRA
jgi:hypothetical protein